MQTNPPTQPSATEAEVLDFAHRMFQLAREGDAEALRPMLERGLPPNMTNHKGDTLVMLASYHGQLEATRLLLEKGADPNRYNDMAQTPLAGAAFKGNLAMAELLMAHGADVNLAPPGGKPPLMFAAMFNRCEILDLLIGRGADPHAVSSDGKTALALAEAMGAADTAAQLASLIGGRSNPTQDGAQAVHADAMKNPIPPNPTDKLEDAIDNGEHKGAKTVDNPAPGTPGNAEGAIDGGGDGKTAEEKAEQTTLSNGSSGSGGSSGS